MSDSSSLAPQRPRVWPLAVAGVLLVCAAVAVGRIYEVPRFIGLDMNGGRATATVQHEQGAANEPVYVLRYEHPEGSIYRSRYAGPFPLGVPEDGAEIAIRYDRASPGDFQPAGVSYLPGAATGALFFGGLFCVLAARARIHRHIRRLHGKVA